MLKNLNLKNAEGLGVGGGAKICSGGCEYMLRGVRPDRGAPPETAYAHIHNILTHTTHSFTHTHNTLIHTHNMVH